MNTPAPPDSDAAGGQPPSDDLHAAEYALGLLDAQSRRAANARAAQDRRFAALIEAWEQRFAPWLDELAPVAPSSAVWNRIVLRIGRPRAGATGVWNNVAFWRVATGLAAAAAIAIAFVGFQSRAPRAPVGEEQAARPVTVLARDDGSTGWIASLDMTQGKVRMVPVPSARDPGGRVDELWIIPVGQKPISLGFVSNEKAHSIAFPQTLRSAFAVGATLAITLEPEAGMPHAAPSGPIVAKGTIQSI